MRFNNKLVLIFLLAVLLRAAPNLYLEFKQPGYHADNINEIEFYYDDVARSLIAGKGFVHSVNPRSEDSPFNFKPGTAFHFVPPLYAWWVSLIYLVFGPNVLIAKLFQCLLDAAVCLLLFKIVWVIKKDHAVALLSALIYAVYPLAIYMSMTLYYQIPMNLALCWLVLCLMDNITLKNGILTGGATAISALAKPVTLPLLLIIPVVKVIECYKDKNLKLFSPWVLGFLITCTLILTPWTIRNYLVFHRFIPVQSGAASPLLQGSKEEYVDLDVVSLRKKYGPNFGVKTDEFVHSAIENHLTQLKQNPFNYLRFLGKKFFLTWYNTEGKAKNFYALLSQIPFLLLVLFALMTNYRYWLKRPNWYVPGIILYICLIQVIFFPLVRYTLAVMPLVTLISAFGLNELIHIIKRLRKERMKSAQLT